MQYSNLEICITSVLSMYADSCTNLSDNMRNVTGSQEIHVMDPSEDQYSVQSKIFQQCQGNNIHRNEQN